MKATMYSFREGVVLLGPMTRDESTMASAFAIASGCRLRDLYVQADGEEARVWLRCESAYLHVLVGFGCALRGVVTIDSPKGVRAAS
jgi:hypothetical protein